MQLKFKRYTGSRGLISKGTTYCLEAVLYASSEEHERISAYDRWTASIWILGDLDLDTDQEEYKTQAMRVSVADLTKGSRFEYKNFNNVIRTENLIIAASKQLISTVNELATFDGTERVVELDDREATLVAAG